MSQATLSTLPRTSLRFDGTTPRTALLWLCGGIYCAVSGATRGALVAKATAAGQVALGEMPRIFLTGLACDAVTSLYLLAPLALYLAVISPRFFANRWNRRVLHSCLTAVLFGFFYLGIVEYFFFDEFNARFNIVAVEYLIYPHEVFINIWQSYPVLRALIGAALVTAVTVIWARRFLARFAASADRLRAIRLHAAGLLAVLIAAHMAVDFNTGRRHDNRVADELGANGVYSFFDALMNNRLEYDEYYVTLPEHEAVERVRRLLAQKNATFIAGAQNPLARKVVYPGPAKRLNVVVILEESLGAEFVGAYGDRRGLTPNIDRLARESVVFTKTYATGTRTVRGMEAVTASFPPVPAESIVKRPHNEGMFNWSTVMRDARYDPTFVYGGYGAFDNMNYFFGHNGYRVIDRSDIDKPRFTNIWGVSDEDLFQHALKVYDEQHAKGERIFSVVMTTSNHKPYTFPAGVEGVPPKGGGREAGVRYADYAIGKFVEGLRSKPYFDDTVVVIVADHGARVYGKEDFPLHSYEIPFLVYSPKHFPARRVDSVTSQLDVAPTVLGLLGISYDSAFFGRDVLADPPAVHALPLNHNRDIALLVDRRLNQLGFHKTASTVVQLTDSGRQHAVEHDDEGLKDAASYFQLAYSLYSRGLYGAR